MGQEIVIKAAPWTHWRTYHAPDTRNLSAEERRKTRPQLRVVEGSA